MGTAASTAVSIKVLLYWGKPITENIKPSFIRFFLFLSHLIKYVSENINTTDTFLLIVSSDAVNGLLDDPIYYFSQVRRIYVYYDNDNDLKRDKNRLQNMYRKLRFCHERNLQTHIEQLMVNNAISSRRSIDRSTINDVASSWEERISTKRPNTAGRHSTSPSRFATASKHGFSVKNSEQIDPRYICPFCKSVMRQPYQLHCGHRACQGCINIKNDKMTCLTCSEISLNKNIWYDQGFHNEMLQLLVLCSVCDWTGCLGLYQKHIDQKHPDRESAIATEAYSPQTHQRGHCEPAHTTEIRQQILSDTLSFFGSMYIPNNSNAVNDQHVILSAQVQEAICGLLNNMNILINEQQRIDNEFRRSQSLLQIVAQNFFTLRTSFEEVVYYANGLKIIQDLFAQQIWSLKRIVDDALFRSVNGTYIWKITGVQEKIVDAQSERQKSIYSPPFYSSPTGYKMCLRLYLNGDGDTRNTHLSLFLVIMRGDYDAILEWPFSYKILFRLIDQLTSNDHECSFWSDIRSNCFQRPVSNMNSGYGIEKFLSLVQFEQNQSLYVKDDTMFIEAKIDFLSKRPTLSSISSTGGTPNDEGHVDTISEDFMHIN